MPQRDDGRNETPKTHHSGPKLWFLRLLGYLNICKRRKRRKLERLSRESDYDLLMKILTFVVVVGSVIILVNGFLVYRATEAQHRQEKAICAIRTFANTAAQGALDHPPRPRPGQTAAEVKAGAQRLLRLGAEMKETGIHCPPDKKVTP
jgi:hypothetical protein